MKTAKLMYSTYIFFNLFKQNTFKHTNLAHTSFFYISNFVNININCVITQI